MYLDPEYCREVVTRLLRHIAQCRSHTIEGPWAIELHWVDERPKPLPGTTSIPALMKIVVERPPKPTFEKTFWEITSYARELLWALPRPSEPCVQRFEFEKKDGL
jgi:hypothetical protein